MRRTETQHRHAPGLHARPPGTVLAQLLEGQQEATSAVAAAIPAIAGAAEAAASALRDEHRVGYAGAGSSGLMALADALELAGTFGIPPSRTPVLFAGGTAALLAMTGVVEDDTGPAVRDLEAAGLGSGDLLVAVSASGSTPYTLAVVAAARDRGVAIIGIANAAGSPLLAAADHAILLDTGPEVVAGSTRMGAATAQKIALNLFSTLTGLLLGHVHDGYMVNVVADNAKLRDRAARIVASIAGADAATAADALATTGGRVKAAVLVAAGARPEAADQLLATTGGHIGAALAAFQQ